MNSEVTNILVGRKKVEWIAYNHKISAHAKLQLMRRAATDLNTTSAILNSPLAWKLSEGYIAVAINLFEYFIIGHDVEQKLEATIVTYINLKEDNCSVIDKMLVAYQEAIVNEVNNRTPRRK